MKRFLILILALFLLSAFLSCSSSECGPPDELFRKIEKSYGDLAPGLFFDSRAKEWEEHYLDTSLIESIFGDEQEYKAAVASAYIYLSASLSVYEEIIVLECYTSNKALRMAGGLSERSRALGKLEDVPLEAEILCRGRTVAYCRLADHTRAKSAIRKIEE